MDRCKADEKNSARKMKAWEELLSSLEKQLGSETVKKWLRPIKIVRFDAANLYLEATPFQRNWFEEHIFPRIIGVFRNNNHRPIKINWETKEIAKPILTPAHTPSLEPSYRIDTFLPTQPVALELAREIITQGKASFNPALFFGESGSGKTHLLMGIAAGLIEQRRNALYLHADTFTEQVVQAIRSGQMQEFRKSVRAVDVLLVDGIDLFARKNATQEEFFHTFNTLHSTGRQLVLSSSQPPYQMKEIEQRLTSRFEWGVAIPLPTPNHEQLKKMLEEKMTLLSLSPSEDVVSFLLDRFRSSPKASLHALHLLALRMPNTNRVSHLQLEQLLADQLKKEKSFEITPERIIKETAAYFKIRVEDLLGKSHMRSYVEPRKIALYLNRIFLNIPFQKIGMLFHRDHSTVMTSISDVEQAVAQRESPFAEAVDYLKRALQHNH